MRSQTLQRLWTIRGMPGSGKTTLAEMLAMLPRTLAVSTDDSFTTPEGYKFDPELLGWAHRQCKQRVLRAMAAGNNETGEPYLNIIVHNTFSQNWEIEPYRVLANRYRWELFIVEAQNNFGSVHDVTKDAMKRMENRWEKVTI